MEDIQDDPRFAHILSDPKFRVMPKSKKKVKIDSRFRSVFNSEHFSHKTDIDKRGRPVFDVTKRNRHVMKRFYELSDDDDDDDDDDKNDDIKIEPDQEVKVKQKIEKKRKNKRSKIDDGLSNQSFSETECTPQTLTHSPEEQNKKQSDKKKTLTNSKLVSGRKDNTSEKSSTENDGEVLDQSDQEDSSSCTTDEDDDDDSDAELPEFSQEYALQETDVEHKWNELHTDAVTGVESTCRLAVCNMDWDFVKAQDLFVLFKSFVPDGGRVKSVTIYPSEFGKERMAEEAMLGPREIRAQKDQETGKTDTEGHGGQKKNRSTNQQQMKRATKDLEATQTEKLREYQLNRLRYYFAVVDCDSVVTAETIYNECDGREYLLSSVRLDLRFIPDDMTFDDPPREVFSQEQSILEYEPNRFSSTALCQAKVDVTWDETDFDRLSRRIGGMQQKELESIVEENKYADIIAPPESDSDQEADDQPDWLKQALHSNGDSELNEEDKIAIYRKLLMEKLDGEESDDDGDKKEKGEEKELVWTPGLKSSLVKRMEKKERKRENTGVVNDYLEKKKDKKKKKKEDRVKKQTTNEKEEVDVANNNTNERLDALSAHTQTKKKKQKRNQADEKAEAKNTADLELLVMADDDVKDKYTEKEQPGKKKSKKLKMKKKKLADVQDGFQLDMSDPRFGALYTSQHFHIDPSSSQFKKSTHMAALMNEQIKRRGHSGKPKNVTGSMSEQKVEHSRSVSQALVESIRSKMKK